MQIYCFNDKEIKGSSFLNWSFRASVDILCDSLALKGGKIMAIRILNYRNLDTSLLSMPFKSELFQIYHHRDPLTAAFNLLAEGWSKTEGSLQLASFNSDESFLLNGRAVVSKPSRNIHIFSIQLGSFKSKLATREPPSAKFVTNKYLSYLRRTGVRICRMRMQILTHNCTLNIPLS